MTDLQKLLLRGLAVFVAVLVIAYLFGFLKG